MDAIFLVQGATSTKAKVMKAPKQKASAKNGRKGPAKTIRKSKKSAISLSAPQASAEKEYPRVNSKMTVAQLKEEAVVRGHNVKLLPKIKLELLYFLVDGSIALKDTREFREFAALRARMEEEKSTLGEHNMRRRDELERAAEARKARNEISRVEKNRKQRIDEKNRQTSLHTVFLPRVHSCKLAPASQLMFNGEPRHSASQRCNKCRNLISGGAFSCDTCEWDICSNCYRLETMSPSERRELAERRAREEAERNRIIAARMKRIEEKRKRHEEKRSRREAAIRAAYDPTLFTKAVKEPSKIARNKNNARAFTVWKSLGYPPDGFHSYAGEPTKEFDSSWSNKKEANLRARYLFFIDNAWGIGPEELGTDVKMKESKGLEYLEVSGGDSECWTVSVVPSDCFVLLDNAEGCLDDDDWDGMNSRIDWDRQESIIQAAYKPSQFTNAVKELSKAAQDKRNTRGFTVWKSLGYPPDRFHSYGGDPTKIFDSSWSTKKEANLRARYLFFIKNDWGIGPDELGLEVSMKERNGLARLGVSGGDSQRWTVGVVPSDGFHLLDNAGACSDEDNDEEEESDSDTMMYPYPFMF